MLAQNLEHGFQLKTCQQCLESQGGRSSRQEEDQDDQEQGRQRKKSQGKTCSLKIGRLVKRRRSVQHLTIDPMPMPPWSLQSLSKTKKVSAKQQNLIGNSVPHGRCFSQPKTQMTQFCQRTKIHKQLSPGGVPGV